MIDEKELNKALEEYQHTHLIENYSGQLLHCKENVPCGNRSCISRIWNKAKEIVNRLAGKVTLEEYQGQNTVDAAELMGKSEQVKGGWIPCSKCLPEEPNEKIQSSADVEKAILGDKVKEYNVTIRGASLPTTLYYVGDGYWWDEKTEDFCSVIAWQPLPEVYQE